MIGSIMGLVAVATLFYLLITQEKNHAEQQAEWTRERTILLNRIKPETAQPVLGEPDYPSPRGVVPDDDEAFWRAHGIDTSEVR